ncbi:MAG: ArsR family transcriptional regulator [Spirochaetaceae bacterium]|nr:MAG: ArsR family transcriptional regulator [Spirochaetaceae bacterium]
MRTVTETADVFKALGDETRLRIVHLLLHSDTALCVCEMVDSLHLPQYQISRHLGVLKNAGVVAVDRKGTWAYYCLVQNGNLLRALWQVLERSLKQQQFSRDAAQLDLRLAQRAHGECVVGFVSLEEPGGKTVQSRADVKT